MPVISKPYIDSTAKLSPTTPYKNKRFSTLSRAFKRSLIPAFLAVTFLPVISFQAQGALPEAIEAALSKAELTPADISIIITPIGDKNTSRLPPIVHVLDDNTSRAHQQKVTSAQNKNIQNASAIITLDKQAILQQERKLNAYTDDPYTHYSLNSPTPILPSTSADRLANKDSTTNKDVASLQPALRSLVRHQPDIARTPASTMKLVPSLIALDTLGANFVWHTRVYHTGMVIGKRLYGDLVIQGSGDPKMTHERLEQLLYKVKQAGIQHIDGDIILDSAIFSKVGKDPAAFDRSPLRSYNASPDGFLVNFNTVALKSYPLGNSQVALSYTPMLANYHLPESISTRTGFCSQARYSLNPQWQTERLTFNTKLPQSCGEHIFYIAYPDSKDFAARVVAAKWQQLDNTLTGKVIAQETPYSAGDMEHTFKKRPGLKALALTPLPITSYPSLPLSQQIYDINHYSNNVLTEQVALSISAYNENNASKTSSLAQKPPATSLYQFGNVNATDYPQALQYINQWWQTHLSTPPPYLTNGSGLCRDCTISAANLNELLTYAYEHPSFAAYVNSLGVAGVSGTIAYHSQRMPESAAIGRAWIKTGTLNNVTAMAGYVKAQSGQDYTVVGLINTEQALNPDIARPVLDTMLDWTAKQ